MKRILFIIILLISFRAFSQPVVARSNGSITVQDYRSYPKLNSVVPTYLDTSAANDVTALGLNLAGALIYTQADAKYWIRKGVGGVSGVYWQEVGSGGSGSITNGANGLTKNGTILELGSATQNASTFSTDRYINTQGFEQYWKSRSSYVSIGADSSVAGGAGYIDLRGPYGGAINFKSDTIARTTNAIQWEKQGVLQAVVGNDIGPSTHHFFIDIYGSTNSVNLEAGGVAFAQFGTAAQYLALRANSRLNIGATGTIGGQTANVIGSLSGSDSVLFTRKIVSSSSADSVWVSGTDGLLKHRAQTDINAQNFANANLTLTGNRDHDLDGHTLLIENGVISLQAGTSMFVDGQDLEISNLANRAEQDRLLGQRSSNGKVDYVTIGSNLTLSSGVLAATGSGSSNFTFPDSLKVVDAFEYGVVFDGTTDNITALRNMRNKAATTGWPLRFGPGVLYASDSVTFNEMVLIGNGTTVKTTNTSLTIFNIKDSCDVQGFTFIGTGKAALIPVGVFTLQNGIRVFGSGNAIHNCVFTSMNGSGITLWNGSQIRSNNIYGCRFNTNTIGVYAMSNNEYTSVDNNFFEDNYVGGYERSSSNCMWKNNTFEFDDNAGFRVRGDGADHGKFINNTVNHGGTYGIYFENNAISYLVMDNYIYSSNIGIGVDDTCHNVQFSHNVIANSTISGTKNVRVRIFDNTYISPITVTTTGVTYYNNWSSSDPTLAHPDSLVLSQAAGYYRFTNMTSTIDTTTYKWVGMDVNGKIARGNGWGNLKLPIVVGTTPVSGGTSPNILYNNSNVLGELTTTGSGTVVPLQTSPTFVTRITSPIVTGSASANGTLTLTGNNAGASNTAANSNLIFATGNTPTNAMVINNAQEIGIGTNPSTGFKLFIVTAGNNASTTAILMRNSSTQNTLQINDLGSTSLGNQSTAGNQLNFYGRSYFANPTGAQITPSAYIHIAAGASGASNAPFKLSTGVSLATPEVGALEYTTPQLFFTNGGGQRQEIPQIQQSRVSTQYDNTTTTLGNVTGLTATVVAGKIYRFEATLYTTSNVGGGIKCAIGGTATATAIVYEGLTTDAGATTQTRSAALGGAVGGVTAVTAAFVRIRGTITVNAAGTITTQAAANTAVGTTSVLAGSTFVLTEMP